MLINLTNHPSVRWSDKQKAAAKVYGEIVDMPFPVIDEAGDEKYIATLADEYLNKIVNLSDTQSSDGRADFLLCLDKTIARAWNHLRCFHYKTNCERGSAG